MDSRHCASRHILQRTIFPLGGTTILVMLFATFTSRGEVAASDATVLRIGTSGSVTAQVADQKTEEGALGVLKAFIEEETGLHNEIVPNENWLALVEGMERGRLQLGIFQGYEFAWVQVKHPAIRPLALAVNGVRYPVACVVVNNSNPAHDFASLRGQSMDIPNTGPAFQRLFVQTQCQSCNESLETFFSEVRPENNVEDALDDVVDGTVHAAVVDMVALEAYKGRKPCRFGQLRQVVKSQPFPPAVIAYSQKSVKLTTLLQFQKGFKEVCTKAKGQTMMMLLRLTDVEKIPVDFTRVLTQTRIDYPPPALATSNPKD